MRRSAFRWAALACQTLFSSLELRVYLCVVSGQLSIQLALGCLPDLSCVARVKEQGKCPAGLSARLPTFTYCLIVVSSVCGPIA